MPTLNGGLTGDGALVDVEVGWGTADAQLQRAALRPVPPAVGVRGLLDTGAEVTCIDNVQVQALGLPSEGITLSNVPAAGGTTFGMQYKANLVIVHPSGNPQEDLTVVDLIVLELALAALGYQVLIGRDVLALCEFLYNGKAGTFTLTY